MAERVDGLLRDKSRSPGIAPLDPELVDQVATRTLKRPGWRPRTGLCVRWPTPSESRPLRSSRSGTSTASHRTAGAASNCRNDKAFAEKLHDVVGLYVCPPAHALVLSVDKKSQIQALARTQPGLPLKKGRGGTMTQGRVWHRTNPCQSY